MKIPAAGQWKIDHSTDRGSGILATKNISFDDISYATLANRTIDVFDESDDSSVHAPMAFYQNPGLTKAIGITGAPFSINIATGAPSEAGDAASNQPTGSLNTSGVFFNNKWFVSMTNDLRSYDGSAWTDETVSWTSGVRHPLCEMKSNRTLLAGNGNKVMQYDTSISAGTTLTLPAGIEVVAIAYNRNFAAVITWDSNNREAWLYIWDGAAASANYAYPLGASRAHFITPYQNTFATLTGMGQLLYWTTDGLKQLDALPCFYTTAQLADVDDRLSVAHDTSVVIDGDKIVFNINTFTAFKNAEKDYYNPLMPSGIWVYTPGVGLHHQHAPSGAHLFYRSVPTANITPATDLITITATVPETGTPFVYTSVDGITIGGLTDNTIYYVIKISATTFKAAATRALALAGTNIDITSKGSAFSYDFLFFPESDFGQLATDTYSGALARTGPQGANTVTSQFTLFLKYAFGFRTVPHNSTGDANDQLGMVIDRSENRGWIIFQKIVAANITEMFQKLIVKGRHLLTANDKIIVKFRVEEDTAMPIYARSSATKGTWTSQTVFTTSADLSAAKTAFDAGKAYEIEIIYGAGSGYLAHISAIAVAAGVYTVTLDETVRGIAANDTMYFIVDNWQKLKTVENEEGMLSSSNMNYSEFPIAQPGKWIQFKIELRGEKVALEELELINSAQKSAL